MTFLDDARPLQPARVLQVVGSLGFGGAESMIMNLYRTLDKDRVQFDFLVFGLGTEGFESEVKDLGGRVLRTAPPNRYNPVRFVRAVTTLIEQNGPYAAVHSHINFASAPVLIAAARAGVPRRIAHAHNAGDSLQGLGRRAYTTASRAVLTHAATDLVGCGQLAGNYVFGPRWNTDGRVIPNAIDFDCFADALPLQGLRDELGVTNDAVLLGAIARLSHQKNHDFMLDLMVRLSEEGVPTDLVLVGQGELLADIERKIEVLGIGQHVHLLGTRRDIPRIMKTLDYMVLPSFHEGLPLVLVEAQAASLPSLVSAHVTSEIDLGLGLVEFLPLDLDAWVAQVRAPKPSPPTRRDTEAALHFGGYMSESSAAKLLEIYSLS